MEKGEGRSYPDHGEELPENGVEETIGDFKTWESPPPPIVENEDGSFSYWRYIEGLFSESAHKTDGHSRPGAFYTVFKKNGSLRLPEIMMRPRKNGKRI